MVDLSCKKKGEDRPDRNGIGKIAKAMVSNARKKGGKTMGRRDSTAKEHWKWKAYLP